jgi:hypothetical protein
LFGSAIDLQNISLVMCCLSFDPLDSDLEGWSDQGAVCPSAQHRNSDVLRLKIRSSPEDSSIGQTRKEKLGRTIR